MVNKSDMAPRFDHDLIGRACGNGDPRAIAILCENIIVLADGIQSALRSRPPASKHAVARGTAISDSEVANFAYRMLKACERHGKPPPRELVDLFQKILHQDRPPHRRHRRWVQREEARRYLEKHPTASARELARHVNVNASTVTRWLKVGALLRIKSVRNTQKGG